jgi:hypothetical protein
MRSARECDRGTTHIRDTHPSHENRPADFVRRRGHMLDCMPSRAAKALLTGLVDYAGLFPPAKLAMPAAAEEFARCRMSEQEWMLGRFVCPASRLLELTKAAGSLMPGTHGTSGYREYAENGEPWRITALIDMDLDPALDAIADFNVRHAAEDSGLAKADMVELKVTKATDIDEALDILPANVYAFFEFPVNTDPRGFVAALAGNQSAAKIRTGGITADAFPTPAQIAAFFIACSAADVPFKATAGLHHPIRGSFPLTYEPNVASCTMHGFLNVFLTAALVRTHRLDEAAAAKVLEKLDAKSVKFTDDKLTVAIPGFGSWDLDAIKLARVRESFALSFGSCSFDEPERELRTLGIL